MRKTSKLGGLFLGIIFFVLCGFFVFPNNASADVDYTYVTVECKNSMTGAQVDGCSVSLSSNHNPSVDIWSAEFPSHTSSDCNCWTCHGFCSASGVTGSSCSTTPIGTPCTHNTLSALTFGSSDNSWGFNCDHNQLSVTLTAPSGYTLVGNSTVGPYTVSNGQNIPFIWYVTPPSPPSCTVPLYVTFDEEGSSPYFLWVDSNSSNINEGIKYFANGFSDADGDREGIQKRVPTGNLNPNTNYWLCAKYTDQPLADWILYWYKITTGDCCYEEGNCDSWSNVGDTQCVGTNAYTLCGTGTPMGFDDDTCLEWHAPILCGSNEVCSGGECVDCSCHWDHQGCGEGSCDGNMSKMYHEQDCSPAGCHESSKCETDALNCGCTDATPGIPTIVSPGDLATGVTVDSVLDWSSGGWGTRCDGDLKNYELYLKAGSAPGPTDPKIDMGTTDLYDPPVNLNYNTTYYWQIKQCNFDCATSPPWSFTTEQAPKLPPCFFTTINPPNPRGYGDVDGNGVVNSIDATSANNSSLIGDAKKAADVNKDGFTDTGDKSRIEAFIAGTIPTLPVCQDLQMFNLRLRPSNYVAGLITPQYDYIQEQNVKIGARVRNIGLVPINVLFNTGFWYDLGGGVSPSGPPNFSISTQPQAQGWSLAVNAMVGFGHSCADVAPFPNGDGFVDILDSSRMAQYLNGTLPAGNGDLEHFDLNYDGWVDAGDSTGILVPQLGTKCSRKDSLGNDISFSASTVGDRQTVARVDWDNKISEGVGNETNNEKISTFKVISGGINHAPVAEAGIRIGSSGDYYQGITVVQDQPVDIWLSADKDVNFDNHASEDPDDWNNIPNGVSSEGKCEWNSNLDQDDPPAFDETIPRPALVANCNFHPGLTTFGDVGTHIYKVLKITDNQGLASTISEVTVIVEEAFDYSLIAPANMGVVRDNNVAGTVSLNYKKGTSQPVTLSASSSLGASGSPALPISAFTFSPSNSCTPTCDPQPELRIHPPSTTTADTYTITVTGNTADGLHLKTDTFILTVYESGPTVSNFVNEGNQYCMLNPGTPGSGVGVEFFKWDYSGPNAAVAFDLAISTGDDRDNPDTMDYRLCSPSTSYAVPVQISQGSYSSPTFCPGTFYQREILDPKDTSSNIIYNRTYHLWIRAIDSINQQSDWDELTLETPDNPYPWPGFTCNGSQNCSGVKVSEGKTVAFASVTTFFDGGSSGRIFDWTIENHSTPGVNAFDSGDAELISGDTFSENLEVKFKKGDYDIFFDVTDSSGLSCNPVQRTLHVSLLLPEWKEIKP